MKRQLFSITAAMILCFPIAAAAQQQSFITGMVQGPDGTSLDGATIYICTGLVKAERMPKENAKTRMVLYYSTAQPGSGKCEGTGKTSKGGMFKVRYPEGKQGDLFAWKAGHEALIVHGVTSPSDAGVLKLPGTNDSAIVEKRNIESEQQKAKMKADIRENTRLMRQQKWEEQEKTYPGGVHVPLLGLRDAQLIAEENSLPRRIKAIVQTPSGQLLEDGNENTVRISIGENLQIEKHSAKKWFLTNAVANGTFYGEGRIDVLAPKDKQMDICIWAKGYEPLLIRNVTAPLDLGTVKISGTNSDLEELPHIHK